MAADRTTSLIELLENAEAAHGVYEITELHGAYDQAWAAWYAAFLVEQGIGTTLGHAITPDRLADVLAESFADLRAAEPRPSDTWAAYTARKIAAEL